MSIVRGAKSQARRVARWLLELDRPVPAYTDQEIEAFVERNYRWNFAVNLTDGAAFWLGSSFLAYTTLVPLFISKLTDSMVPIGLAAMLAQSGWSLPQLFTANLVERLPRRKPVVVRVGLLLERLPVWLWAIAALLASRWTGWALALFLVAFTWSRLGGGTIAAAWQDLIARVIPVERRGRFWGLTSAIGAGLGFGGSALSAWLLATYAFPTSFVAIFGLGAAVLSFGWAFTPLIREPACAVRAPRQSQRQFLAKLPHLVREDPPFRRFLVARLLLGLAGMGLGFITIAAVRRWGVTDGTVGIYTGVQLLGQTVGNLVFGLLADRRGHKFTLEWAAVAYLFAFALAWLAPSAGWFFLVFFLLGVGQGILIVSGILVVLEFSGPQRRPTYVGIANTALGVVGVAGPLLASWLAGVDFGLLFALSAGISLLALVAMRWWVREPRWTGGS